MNCPNHHSIPKIPPGYTYHPPLQSHAYGPATRVPAEESETSHEQFEKACLKCGVIRITIIGASNPRAWRLPDSGRLLWREPACEPMPVCEANTEGAAA